ncbi:MAG: hypothetical protein E2O50_06290 [Gammaproteobacteria bacterium]|nr:MAG: hypothetical protein E2O50_06290 [Gammaproteobacteria bacterium]
MKVTTYFVSLVLAIVCIALAFEFGLEQLLPEAYRGYLVEEGEDEVKWGYGPFEPSQATLGFNSPIKLKKPDDTIRIISLGASGTEGWLSAKAVFNKYNQKWENKSLSSYSRVIEFSLNELSGPSSKRVEVINLGVAAYNITDVIRMLKDSLQLDPDLFLIHVGVNEGWTSERSKWSSFLNDEAPYLFDETPYFYSEIGYEIFTEIKAGWTTLDTGGNAFSPMALFKTRGKPIVPEPAGREAGLEDRLENYKSELRRLGTFLSRKKIPAVFLIPTQNLAGFQPFGSMAKVGANEEELDELNRLLIAALAERSPDAKGKYLEILKIDDGVAEANFQLGKIYLQENSPDKAREYFWKANDRDIILKRPPGAFHDATRDFVEKNNFPSIDAMGLLESMSLNANVGNNFIYDDVHPIRTAQYYMGTEVVKIIINSDLLQAENQFDGLQKLPIFDEYNDWTGFDQEAEGSLAFLRAVHNYFAFGRFRQRMNWDPRPDVYLEPIIEYLDVANSYVQNDQSLYLSALLNIFMAQEEEARRVIGEMDCHSSAERAALVRSGMTQSRFQLFGRSNQEVKRKVQQLLDMEGCIK